MALKVKMLNIMDIQCTDEDIYSICCSTNSDLAESYRASNAEGCIIDSW